MASLYSTENIAILEESTQEVNYEFIKKKNNQLNEISNAISKTFLEFVLSSESEDISIEFLRVASKIREAFDPLKRWETFEISNILLSKYEPTPPDIGVIKSKVYKISEEAELFISKNKNSIEVINEIIEKTQELLIKIGKFFRMELYVEKDKEITTWEDLVFSVSVKEKDFDNMIKMWDEIENIVEEVVDSQFKKYKGKTEISTIKELDNKLTIEVKELEGV